MTESKALRKQSNRNKHNFLALFTNTLFVWPRYLAGMAEVSSREINPTLPIPRANPLADDGGLIS
jgi:hypothetical protein